MRRGHAVRRSVRASGRGRSCRMVAPGTQEALSIKLVPSLQALLRCCDERLLVRATRRGACGPGRRLGCASGEAQAGGREAVGGHVGHDAGGLPLDKKGARAACCCRTSRSCCTRAAADRAPRVRGAALARRRAARAQGRPAFRCRDAARGSRRGRSRVPTRSIRGERTLASRVAGRFPVLPRALPRAGGSVLGR